MSSAPHPAGFPIGRDALARSLSGWGEGCDARLSNLTDTTHEAGFSLSSFGGEGWGEEAVNYLTALRPFSNFLGGLLHEPVVRVAGITASSPRPSPPKEERGPAKRALRPILNQTQWQWGWGEGPFFLS